MSRPYQACTHVDSDGQPLHSHGTRTAYLRDGCRCRSCKDANTREQAARRRLKLYGRYDDGREDPTSTRAHIEVLLDAGISIDQIHKLAGVGRTTLHKIRGSYSPGMPPARTVLRTHRDAILALEPDPIKYAHPNRPLNGCGTQRRLQALVAIGWTQTELGARIGMTVQNMGILMHGDSVMIEARTVRAVLALYDDLWDKPKDGDFASRVARRSAEKYGWVSPLAWDDDDIDDPRKEPAILGRREAGSNVFRTYVNYADVIHLLDGGTGYGEVLRRMNIQDLQTLRLGLTRRGRRDLADGFAKTDRNGSQFVISA